MTVFSAVRRKLWSVVLVVATPLAGLAHKQKLGSNFRFTDCVRISAVMMIIRRSTTRADIPSLGNLAAAE